MELKQPRVKPSCSICGQDAYGKLEAIGLHEQYVCDSNKCQKELRRLREIAHDTALKQNQRAARQCKYYKGKCPPGVGCPQGVWTTVGGAGCHKSYPR